MKECLLCGKNYKLSKKELFGKACLNQLYNLMNLSKPDSVKDKEKYLINRIAKENNKNNLKLYQKQLLAERYLTLLYLDDINYGNFEKIKNDIREEIKLIDNTKFEKDLKTIKKIKLNDAYKLHKKSQKFDNNIKFLNKDKTLNEQEAIKYILNGFKFIFDINSTKNKYEKAMLQQMQLTILELVATGGRVFNFNLAADLLQHSLQKNPKDVTIEDKEIINQIIDDANFKSTINNMIDKYGNNTNYFNIEKNEEDKFMFDNKDLYFAIHGVYVIMEATKKENNKWDLNILLQDKYDYTDFKDIWKYYFDANSIPKSIVSSILYNIAYFAQKDGTLTPYDINIKIKLDNYSKEE